MRDPAAGMMDLCDYGQVRALLAEAGFSFSKGKGQNFLTRQWVPERIAEVCGADADTGVFEIGPGVGCLTERLCQRAGRVVSCELDGRLRPVLEKTLGRFDNLDLMFADALKLDLAGEVRERLSGLRPVFCSNLPYNITTPVLLRVFEARCFDTATVMVQREFAERMCAGPGRGDYGAFSLLTQWYAEPELCFTVGPECFVPRPKVTSAVVHIKMREVPPYETDERALFAVVRAAFSQRRKTLKNALGGIYEKDKTAAALKSCGFGENVRGEELSLADFVALTDEFLNITE